LLTHIAATGRSVSLCVGMKSWLRFWIAGVREKEILIPFRAAW
jgi:hypothetical protein